MSKIERLVSQWRRRGPAWWAEHKFGWILPETGRAIKLERWQRAVLDAWWKHRDTTSTLAISNVKKTGKTTLDAILTCWRWLALPGEHLCAANDLDQSQGRQFKMIDKMCEKHPLLAAHVKSRAKVLTFEPTGSELMALSVSAAGDAGANHLTSSHTEAWGIMYEGGIRAFEELTPQPGLFYGLPALRVVDSYAGFIGESETWHDLLDRGLEGERVSRRWPVFKVGGLLLFHMEGQEARERCFRGSKAQARAYYADQRASLRPGAFTRMHANRRASAEDVFITPEMWDALVMPEYRCPGADQSLSLFVGLDVGVKHDHCAAVSVFQAQGALWLGPYRIWEPTPTVDLDAVERYLLDLNASFGRIDIGADPYQAQHIIQRLDKRGVSIAEFPQTLTNLTLLGNTLFDVIRQGRLIVYPGADELRRHVLNATAKETPRGIRLVKSKASMKIDAAISLGEAVVRAQPAREYPGPKTTPYV